MIMTCRRGSQSLRRHHRHPFDTAETLVERRDELRFVSLCGSDDGRVGKAESSRAASAEFAQRVPKEIRTQGRKSTSSASSRTSAASSAARCPRLASSTVTTSRNTYSINRRRPKSPRRRDSMADAAAAWCTSRRLGNAMRKLESRTIAGRCQSPYATVSISSLSRSLPGGNSCGRRERRLAALLSSARPGNVRAESLVDGIVDCPCPRTIRLRLERSIGPGVQVADSGVHACTVTHVCG